MVIIIINNHEILPIYKPNPMSTVYAKMSPKIDNIDFI